MAKLRGPGATGRARDGKIALRRPCLLFSSSPLLLFLFTAAALLAGCSARGGAKPGAREEAVRPAAVEATRKIAIPDRIIALKNPYAGDASVLEEGRRQYQRHCATCHGDDGRAHTEIGANLFPPASDLLDPSVRDYTDGRLYWIISEGVHQSGMPAWKSVISRAEIWKVVRYVRDQQRRGLKG